LSPTANPAGIWEGIARGEPDCRSGGGLLLNVLPAFRRMNKEQCMDVVYILIGLAFFAVSYAFVELIMRL
jgi:hypothetical protein